MGKIFINARYFMAPLLIIVTAFGLAIGGLFVWTGVALFVIGVTIDTLTMFFHPPGAGVDSNGNPNASPALQNSVMYFMLPVFVVLQVIFVYRLFEYTFGTEPQIMYLLGAVPVQLGITGSQLIGATLSTGIFAGIGIIYGHELSHTKGFSFVISRLMMELSGSAHFCYAHVYNHHLELACEDDPATSPRGRSIYRHFWLSHMGQSKFLFQMEAQRLKRVNSSFLSFNNRWIRGYLMSLPTIFLFVWAGGLIGVACLFAIWTISNFELEALNYMEHYGLIREKGQPIDYHHSWDNDSLFTSWFFI